MLETQTNRKFAFNGTQSPILFVGAPFWHSVGGGGDNAIGLVKLIA